MFEFGNISIQLSICFSRISALNSVAPSVFGRPNWPFRCCVHNCRAVRSARIKPEVAGGGVAEIQNGVETCAKTHITQNLNTSPPIHTHTHNTQTPTPTQRTSQSHHERVYSAEPDPEISGKHHTSNQFVSQHARIWLITVGARNQNSLFARASHNRAHAHTKRNACQWPAQPVLLQCMSLIRGRGEADG